VKPLSPARVPRSYLFVPGNRPERFDKALAAGAHRVIIDLEDAVPLDGKNDARAAVAAWLSSEHRVTVRINGTGTPWFEDDLGLCVSDGVEAIVLPKAEDASVIAGIRHVTGDRVAVLPLIETARGLWNALDVARAPGVERLMFGSLDYQLDLNIVEEELLHARAQLVLVSRVAELVPPVDAVTASFDDTAMVRRDAARARGMGFGGKLCIHPRQVTEVNAAFRPTQDEIAWAQRVIAADAASPGAAVAVDGKMVDRPVLLKAQTILIEADLMVPI